MLKPFQAVRYSTDRIPDLSVVLSLPYDQLTRDDHRDLLARHPRNVVRLILGEDWPWDLPVETRYQSAGEALKTWMEEGSLIEEVEPALYLHRQTFSWPSGEERTRLGLVGLIDLTSPAILAHERTYPEPQADRLASLAQTGANLGQVMLVAPDEEGTLYRFLSSRRGDPIIRGHLPSTGRHEILRLPVEALEVVQSLLVPPLVIADGHHRFAAARDYLAQSDCEESRYLMVTLLSGADPGLIILPTHRVLSGGEEASAEGLRERLMARFTVDVVPVTDEEALHSAVARLGHWSRQDVVLLGLRASGEVGWLLHRAREGDELDVGVLHQEILEGELGHAELKERGALSFVRDPVEVWLKIRGGEATWGWLLRPVTVADVIREARAGRPMPQKSTDFYPKLPSGLLMRRLGSGW